MAADVPANSLRTGEDLLYAKIEPLDVQRHAKLGMMRTDHPYGFAAKQNVVPLQVGEFGVAAIYFPIIFAGEARAPLAVMGVKTGENLFAREDGGFRNAVYVPSFLRRYPFTTAMNEQNSRLFFFIDRACPLFTEDSPDVMLFENGQPTAFTQGCIEFCRRYDADQRQTVAFVDQLNDLDLFEVHKTDFTPYREDGGAAPAELVAEYFAVSEQKLKALSPQMLANLRDSGALAQIYAHRLSLLIWDRLIQESVLRGRSADHPANG